MCGERAELGFRSNVLTRRRTTQAAVGFGWLVACLENAQNNVGTQTAWLQ